MSESRSLAAFWYRWADGHANVFHLAVARFDDDDHLIPGVACIKATINAEDIVYTVLESDASPWSEFGGFGGIAPRDSVLRDSARVFALVDLIAAREGRLSDRIAAIIPRA